MEGSTDREGRETGHAFFCFYGLHCLLAAVRCFFGKATGETATSLDLSTF